NEAPSVSKLDKEVLKLNEQVCYINDEGVLYEYETDSFMPPSVFTNSPKYGSIKIPVTAMTKKGPVEKPPILVAKEWLTHPNARCYGSTVFRPGRPRQYDEAGKGRVLTRWQGFRSQEGDVRVF